MTRALRTRLTDGRLLAALIVAGTRHDPPGLASCASIRSRS